MIRLLEAIKKPSDITKTKTNKRTKKVSYLAGDVYDTVSGTYEDDFTYADYSYEGYIYDKNGNKYNLVANITTGDAGRIAGGLLNYYVTIFYNSIKLSWTGYNAMSSRPYNDDIIDDLGKGYYLEDYCAKHPDAKSGSDIVKELAENGDANWVDYRVTAKNNDSASYLSVINKNDIRLSVLVDNVFSCISKDNDIAIQNAIINTKYIQDYLSNSLFINGYDYSDFKGSYLIINIINVGEDFVVTKSGELMCRCFDKYKNGNIKGFVLKNAELEILSIDLRNCDFKNKLDDVICKYRKKQRTNTINSIVNSAYMYWGKYKISNGRTFRTKGEIRDYAKDAYDSGTQDLLRGYLSFSVFISFLEDMPEKQLNAAVKTLVLDDTDSTVDVKLSSIKGIAVTQDCYDKMLAWHNGERRENIKAANVDKLATYYRVCKEKGYDSEVEKLATVLKDKGVTIDESYNRNLRRRRIYR